MGCGPQPFPWTSDGSEKLASRHRAEYEGERAVPRTPELRSANAPITIPSVVRDLLIVDPSFKRAPEAPVLDCRSDPAKSTNEILLTFSPIRLPPG